MGVTIKWEGEKGSITEVGRDAKTNKIRVLVNPKYFRPAEVEFLLGDPTKAKEKLGWTPEVLTWVVLPTCCMG